eukprot:g21136.t1
MTELPSGLKYADVRVGTGDNPKPGTKVTIDYVMMTTGARYGNKIDSTKDREAPYSFVLGDASIIQGLSEAVSTMREGGIRRIVIPQSLGFTDGSKQPVPPNFAEFQRFRNIYLNPNRARRLIIPGEFATTAGIAATSSRRAFCASTRETQWVAHSRAPAATRRRRRFPRDGSRTLNRSCPPCKGRSSASPAAPRAPDWWPPRPPRRKETTGGAHVVMLNRQRTDASLAPHCREHPGAGDRAVAAEKALREQENGDPHCSPCPQLQ